MYFLPRKIENKIENTIKIGKKQYKIFSRLKKFKRLVNFLSASSFDIFPTHKRASKIIQNIKSRRYLKTMQGKKISILIKYNTTTIPIKGNSEIVEKPSAIKIG